MAAISTLLSGYHTLRSHREMYSESRLRPLHKYRYQGVDKSPISRYILSHYWNWVVGLLPLWMAPNLITAVGLSWMFAALVVVLYYTPDLVGPGPAWTYFFYALCLWLYSTFDNVDGKQARRTGSSSPLGELFDHGCDALNCSIGGLVQIAAMGLGSSPYSMLVLTIALWAFYLPTWEQYHTGVLYLGYINGPTEGILAAIGMITISGIYGPMIWQLTFGQQFLGVFTGTFLEHSKIIDAFVFFFVSIFLFFHVPVCILAVRHARREKGKPLGPALAGLIPMLLVSLSTIGWLWSPYSHIRASHYPLFVLSLGLGFGKMATKIIYAHITQRNFPCHSGLLLPLFLGSILINLPLINEEWSILHGKGEVIFLWGWFVIAMVGYINWSYHVIRSFCSYLDINCFSIKSRKKVP